MTTEQEIIFEVKGQLGVVILNRPKALNALTHEMTIELKSRLDDWATDDAVHAVLIKGAGEKAFCAGGDIVKLYNEGKSGGDYPYRFYHDEYLCNAAVKNFPKPYIAFIDGIVMGGGVGVSVHGTHRIATERTLFAMPESGIGLFPDVGGTHFLPRCPGEIGMYLGLTGARMKAADTLYTGVANAYVHSDNLPGLEQVLTTMQFSKDPHGDINQLISVYAEDPGQAPIAELQEGIDRHFAANDVNVILENLDGAGDEWAAKVAAGLRSKSPTSMKVTCKQIREGASLGFNDCMKLEWRLVNRIIKGLDFYEGTRAVVIDKDQNPIWSPASLSEVTEEGVALYFAPLENGDLEL